MLVVVYYVSKWVEVFAFPNNETKNVSQFLKRYNFTQFGNRAIMTYESSYFCNHSIWSLLNKYGVKNKLASPFHH